MEHIYVDGSFDPNNKTIGFGVYCDTKSIPEAKGGFGLKTKHHLHEHIALIEGALHAKRHGFDPTKTTFHSDLLQLSDERRASCRAGYLKAMIACRKYYSGSEVTDALVYLEQASVKWVRGHKWSIGNSRADYLARVGREHGQPKDFGMWLNRWLKARSPTKPVAD